MPEVRPALIAVDDGYAQVKVWHPKQQFLCPSSVRAGESRIASLDGDRAGLSYITEGSTYSASESVPSEETAFDGYHTSPLNRVAVHHALHRCQLSGREIVLCLGLPVREFYRNGLPNKDVLEAKRASFAIPVQPADPGLPEITAKRVRIFPQAVAAWIDSRYDTDIKPIAGVDRAAPVAIVDIGGRTTDIAVVFDNNIDHARSGTENVGMIAVRDALEHGVQQKFGVSQKLPAKILVDAVQSGTISLWGQRQDVADLVEKASATVAAQIQRFIRRMLVDGADLSEIIFVGGGSKFFRTLPTAFRNAKAVKDPEFANARGIWKLGRNRELMEEKTGA